MTSQVIFVCGVGRSGTTAMGELLNAHPHVCLGIERYKFRFLKLRDFSDDLFDQGRFFNFDPEDTNVLPNNGNKWDVLYQSMASRWAEAKVVGDKIPDLTRVIDDALNAYPSAKFIYMLRGIDGIASSWNARATDPKDNWAKTADFRVAVDKWNTANAIVARHIAANPSRFCVVSYERFFSGSVRELKRLSDFIGIQPHAAIDTAYDLSADHYRNVVLVKKRLELSGQHEHLAKHARFEEYRRLLDCS